MTPAKQEMCTDAMNALKNRRIPFTTSNGGVHIIVEGVCCYVDYWPTTGKWSARDGEKGFGFRTLLKKVRMK